MVVENAGKSGRMPITLRTMKRIVVEGVNDVEDGISKSQSKSNSPSHSRTEKFLDRFIDLLILIGLVGIPYSVFLWVVTS